MAGPASIAGNETFGDPLTPAAPPPQAARAIATIETRKAILYIGTPPSCLSRKDLTEDFRTPGAFRRQNYAFRVSPPGLSSSFSFEELR